MTETRSACFSWNCVAEFEIDDRLRRHLQHEVNRLCRLSAAAGRGKHHLLVNLRRYAVEGRCRVSLTLRHGGFVFAASEVDADPVAAFEEASKTLEEAIERLYRFQGTRRPPPVEGVPEPVERTGRFVPHDATDILKEMAADYLKRLRRYARRRLRTEAILHPEWPVASISDGDVVDEAIVRLARLQPSSLPFGAFWPKAIECCDEALAEYLEDARRAAISEVSLDADLADDSDWDSGYDPERPFEIIERMLNPSEEELEDATPDERSAAPSTLAEYEDFIAYLHEIMKDWPEREHRLIDRYCFEGLSSREIATYEGVDESEVLSVLKKRLRELQQAMMRESG